MKIFSKSRQRNARAICLLVLASIMPGFAMSQEKASLPYATVYDYLEVINSLSHLDQLVPQLTIRSELPEVAIETVEFRIRADDDWQSFSPDKNGVIEFPYNSDWSRRNLTFITNQPRGTMAMDVSFTHKQLTEEVLPYQDLMSVAKQFEEALAALSEITQRTPPKVNGLTIRMPDGKADTLTIQSEKRKQVLKPNATGLINIKFKQALWDENPMVEFSQIPIAMVPLQ